MGYIKYLHRWFKTYGFTFKAQEAYESFVIEYSRSPRSEYVNVKYVLLGPFSYYRELKERDYWKAAARERVELGSNPSLGQIRAYTEAATQFYNKYKNLEAYSKSKNTH